MGIWLQWLLLGFVGGCVLSVVHFTLRLGISPMPSSGKVRDELLRLLGELELQPGEGVAELGCGWGTLLFPIASRLPQCQVYAWERSWVPWAVTRLRLAFTRSQNIVLSREDFLDTAWGDVRVVVCYLYPGAMERLKPRFSESLPVGSWVVSNTFRVPGWTPVKVVRLQDLYATQIYVYKVGESDKPPAETSA